jgi:hypothetical protein
MADWIEERTGVAYHWLYSRTGIILLIAVLTAVSGGAYLWVQWRKTGTITDGPFIGLLIAATVFILWGMRSIHDCVKNRILGFFTCALAERPGENASELAARYHRGIFSTGLMTLSGVLYGLAVASALLLMEVWKGWTALKILMYVFLFIVNFVTGIGFYGLIRFFLRLKWLASYVRVDLWQRENPTTLFFMKVKTQAALLAIVYCSICVFSIFFSDLQKEYLTRGYEVFAGCLVIIVFLLPELPLRRKIRKAKRECLAVINGELDGAFIAPRSNPEKGAGSLDAGRVEKLILLREKVHKMSIWPFGFRTLRTSVSVIFVTILPLLLEHFLKLAFPALAR